MAKDVLNCSKLDDDSQCILDSCINDIQRGKRSVTVATLLMGGATVICLVNAMYDSNVASGVACGVMGLSTFLFVLFD